MFYFYLYIGFALIIITYPPILEATQLDEAFTGFITIMSKYSIEAIGLPVVQNAEYLHLPHSTLKIEYACSGFDIIIILLATILSLNINFYRKALFIFSTIIVVEFLNIIRIVSLGWILENQPKWFDLMHDYVFSGLLFIVVFLFFLRVSLANPNLTKHSL